MSENLQRSISAHNLVCPAFEILLCIPKVHTGSRGNHFKTVCPPRAAILQLCPFPHLFLTGRVVLLKIFEPWTKRALCLRWISLFSLLSSKKLNPVFLSLSQLFTASLSWAFQQQAVPPKYQYRDLVTSDFLLCDQCPPGTAVKRHCTADRPTECQPCPERHFAENWHWGDTCQSCTSVCTMLDRRFMHPLIILFSLVFLLFAVCLLHPCAACSLSFAEVCAVNNIWIYIAVRKLWNLKFVLCYHFCCHCSFHCPRRCDRRLMKSFS